jgi:hypothetical protein
VQGSHHGGEAARCARGRWHTKQVEQGGGANGILVAHGGTYLAVPRVFVVPSNSARASANFPRTLIGDLPHQRSSVFSGTDQLQVFEPNLMTMKG